RSGRCGNDEAVCPENRQEIIVYIGVYRYHGGGLFTADRYIVKRVWEGDTVLFGKDLNDRPFAQHQVALYYTVYIIEDVFFAEACQKTQSAGIDTDDRNFEVLNVDKCIQNSSVSAKTEKEVYA